MRREEERARGTRHTFALFEDDDGRRIGIAGTSWSRKYRRIATPSCDRAARDVGGERKKSSRRNETGTTVALCVCTRTRRTLEWREIFARLFTMLYAPRAADSRGFASYKAERDRGMRYSYERRPKVRNNLSTPPIISDMAARPIPIYVRGRTNGRFCVDEREKETSLPIAITDREEGMSAKCDISVRYEI